MDNNRHTPGPWSVERDTDEGAVVYVTSPSDGICALLKGTGDEADARLIAAAPDLLRCGNKAWIALQDILNAADSGEPYTAAELQKCFSADLNDLRDICDSIMGVGV